MNKTCDNCLGCFDNLVGLTIEATCPFWSPSGCLQVNQVNEIEVIVPKGCLEVWKI